VKISRPVPEKPITEAMQQGKEPLRSFGDLMQFLKKSSPETESKPSTATEPLSQPASETPKSESHAKTNPEVIDTHTTGEDDVGV